MNRQAFFYTALKTEGGAPAWVQIFPPGPHIEGKDGRVWTLDNPEYVAQVSCQDQDLPIDFEHSTELKGTKGEPAPAQGWIKELKAEHDGSVWGRVEWNEKGRKAVENKEYRYLSPVFQHTRAGGIARVLSAALTNQPNLTMKALNREQTEQEEDKTMLKKLLEKLGLQEDATEADAFAALDELQVDLEMEGETPKKDEDSAPETPDVPDTTAPAMNRDGLSMVPRADYDLLAKKIDELEKANADRQKQELDKAINRELDAAVASGKVAPASKEFYRAMCQKAGSVEQFQEFVKSAPDLVPGSGLDGKEPGNGSRLTATERAMCHQMGHTEEEFLRAKEAK